MWIVWVARSIGRAFCHGYGRAFCHGYGCGSRARVRRASRQCATMATMATVAVRGGACGARAGRRARAVAVRVRGGVRTMANDDDADKDAAHDDALTTTLGAGDRVLVIGASGGVGQLVCARLASEGYDVVATTRRERAAGEAGALDGRGLAGAVERVSGVDCRDARALEGCKAFDNIDAVVCCLGTTAFPSKRWRDEDGSWTNGPKETDFESVRNVVDVVKRKSPRCKRFVMVSSVGVLRTNVMPFIILNAFGVLKCKRQGEEYVERSGVPYTLLRPGRLTDGPYTSFDLNTLLKATSGTRRNVQIGGGDDVLLPEATSRLVVAEAACAALACASTANRAYELGSTEGDGPGSDINKWTALFNSV